MTGRLFYGFEAETVFDPQEPISGESLLSLIARTTIENELPHITTIMRDVGQVHRNRMVDVMRKDIDIDGLATILGQNVDVIQSLRSQDVGDHFTRYLGSKVQHGDVHTKERRFAPAALASDELPYYRAAWLFRMFPVCVGSWQVLRSTCSCGAAQTWATVSSLIFCESCGEDLRNLSGEVIPEEERPGLALLANILFGDEKARASAMSCLPTTLQILDPGEIFELALLFTRVVDPTMGNPRAHIWYDQPARLARSLSKVGTLLPSWPKTPWLALDAAGDAKSMLPRTAALKALFRVLKGDYTIKLARSITCDLDRIRLELSVERGKSHSDLIDVGEAAEILGISKRKVRASRAEGHLGVHFMIRGGEVIPAYSRPEIEAMASTNEWHSGAVVANCIGLPTYGLEQLCAMGDIEWAKAPYRTLRAGLRIKSTSTEFFNEKLRSAALPIDQLASPVLLYEVMRGIGGRVKPWGLVVRGLLNREWPYAIGRQGRVIREIYIDARDVGAMRQLMFNPADWPEFPYSTTIAQIDACDILNVATARRHEIGSYRIGKRSGRFLFDRETILSIAADTITSTELGARHFTPTKATMARIGRARLRRNDFGYERAGAVAKFDAA